jgi:hypothetical protein
VVVPRDRRFYWIERGGGSPAGLHPDRRWQQEPHPVCAAGTGRRLAGSLASSGHASSGYPNRIVYPCDHAGSAESVSRFPQMTRVKPSEAPRRRPCLRGKWLKVLNRLASRFVIRDPRRKVNLDRSWSVGVFDRAK